MKIFYTSVLIFLASATVQAQTLFEKHNAKWVDSLMTTMTLDEKIGQLMMPRGNYTNVPYDSTLLLQWVRDYKIGGLVLFANQPTRQALMVNLLQKNSKIPLFIGMDLEWGLTQRLDSTVRFPYAMTQGAMQGGDDLVYKMGIEVGRQCRRMGVHINYAPTGDINNNPNNPVISFRSFSENREIVLNKATAYMKGMQEQQILTSAKHFPGHGDTDVDSHADLPLIRHDRKHLDSLELYPFREMIKRGVNGVMVAHLNVPGLDTTKNLPTTLSKTVIQEVLRKQLNFKGLVFTDAMEMQGVAKFYPPGVANVKALIAGNDILETFMDVPNTVKEIKKAIENKEITLAELDDKVRRILIAKSWAGLDHYQPIELKNLIEDLNPKSAEFLSRTMVENAVTVLKNKDNILPIRDLSKLRIAAVSLGKPVLGTDSPTNFQTMLGNYTTVDAFNLLPSSADSVVEKVKESLKNYDLVIVGIHGLGIRPAAKIAPEVQKLAQNFMNLNNSIVCVFGSPYTLPKFEGIQNAKGLIMAYQETISTQEITAQLIFGALGARGKLPVTVNEDYKVGQGIFTEPIGRFEYTLPEKVGINSKKLAFRIDSLVNLGLNAKAYPGASVLVAKDGKVIFQKTYGYHTYDQSQTVKANDVYDLASITKISTSLPALMAMQDQGKFNLDMTLGQLMPKWKKSNKKDLIMRDILTHQARLRAWIPFWKEIAQNPDGTWKPKTFEDHFSKKFPIQVAEKLFLHKDFSKMLIKAIEESPLNEKTGYVYSDLSYYLYPQIIKRLTGQDFEDFLKENFYAQLGANSLTYNVARIRPLTQIVPTEYDSLFRKELIHGRVHDEGATMLNGISGHAGLFGNANDLAKLIQMYLNGGYYGGKRYLQEKTLKEWTSYPFAVEVNARRGVGFDKPDRKRKGISAAPSASEQSFGHSGFTGTFTWADPKTGILYVFLSNRVYPTRNNSKISDLNIRTQLGEVIISSLGRD